MKYAIWFSIVFALIFHIFFNCLNPFGLFECGFLLSYGLEHVSGTIFVVLWALMMWLFINAFILQFKFQNEYLKSASTSEKASFVLVTLFFGGDMSVECEEIRQKFLWFFRTLLILALSWFSVLVPLSKQ
jgi:hypothetical protein